MPHMPPIAVGAGKEAISLGPIMDFQTGRIPIQPLARRPDRDCTQEDGLGHRAGLSKMGFGLFSPEAGIHEMVVMIARG